MNKLHNKNIKRREKIELGVESFIGSKHLDASQKRTLLYAIEELLVEEGKVDASYVVEQYDKISDFDRSFLFYKFGSHGVHKRFLEFARAIKEERPALFVNALVDFVEYANEKWDRPVDKIEFSNISKELYEIIVKKAYVNGFNVLNALHVLIVSAYRDEAWYEELFTLLWMIESKKEQRDETSLLNYFLIGINSQNRELVEMVSSRFDSWRNVYQSFDLDDIDGFVKHFIKVEKLFKIALRDSVICEARHFTIPSTVEKKIIDELLDTCYAMLEWLLKYGEKKLYFTLLVEYLDRDDYMNDDPIKQREELSNYAKLRFLKEFEPFINENMDDALFVLEKLMAQSQNNYVYTENSNEVLEVIFPMIENIDEKWTQNVAKKVMKERTKGYDGLYSHMLSLPWQPN